MRTSSECRSLGKFRLLLVAAAVLATTLLAPPQPAAASGEVQISSDGVTFSSTYSGTLFGSIVRYIPGDSDQETFYVRNGGSGPGHLRITLANATASDSDLADALTVSASTVNQPGSSATVLSANPCWVLLDGVTLGVGETVAVTTTVALGDLRGLSGQGATADFSIGVALHSEAISLLPTECGVTNTVIPGTAQPPTPGTNSQPRVDELPAGVVPDPAITSPDAESPGDLPVLNLPELLGIDPNTWQLFEEYFVFVLIGGFIAGTVWFAVVAWRRRQNEAEVETEGVAQ